MFEHINVWKCATVAQKNKVEKLWAGEKAVPPPQIAPRLEQLVCLLENEHGELLGVTTAYEQYIEKLQHNMLVFRQYLKPDFRKGLIAVDLANESFQILESYYSNVTNRPLGIFTVIENEKMLGKNYAVWPRVNLTYIGNTSDGRHLRVRYFEKSMITHGD